MGAVAMNKLVVMVVTVFFLTAGNVSATKVTAFGGEEYEIKDQATKMFIYDTMQVWMHHSLVDYYHSKYQADSINWGEPKKEGLRIWIRELEPSENEGKYTHLIKISIQRDELIINDKKKIRTEDEFTYVVNAHILSLCPESGKSEKEFKLINSYHKVRP